MILSRSTCAAIAVGCVGFALTALTANLLDDHFGRITLGYQWWTFGAAPFRDYLDPGLFGAAAWSAIALAVSGGSLIGEVVFDAAAIGTGLGITCALASRAARSIAGGVAAAAISFVAAPRLYDYDKVLSYPAGLWACWHYADGPSARRAAVAGLIIGLAALLRYDSGLYLGSAWAVTLIAVHRRPSRTLFRDAGVSGAVAAALFAPPLIWLLSTGGAIDAIDQIASYAEIERTRTALFEWASLGDDDGLRAAWSGIMRRGATAGYIYLATALLIPVSLAVAMWRARTRGPAQELPLPHVAAAAVLCALLTAFVLRDPLAARFGGVLPVVCILAASLALQTHHRVGRTTNILAMAGAAAAVAYGGELFRRDEYERFVAAPAVYVDALLARGSMFRAMPPSLGVMPGGDQSRRLAWYLRQCTGPSEPVMVTWFAPQTYYFAQRPFGGGIWAFFGGHWTSEARQRQVIARMRHRPPVMVVVDRGRGDFAQQYPLIAEYLQRDYRIGGSTDFDLPRRNGHYQVLVPVDSRWVADDPVWGLPCGRIAPASP